MTYSYESQKTPNLGAEHGIPFAPFATSKLDSDAIGLVTRRRRSLG